MSTVDENNWGANQAFQKTVIPVGETKHLVGRELRERECTDQRGMMNDELIRAVRSTRTLGEVR